MKSDLIHMLAPAAMLLGALAGCASAPQAPACHGEFRPVNREQRLGALLPQAERLAMCEGVRHGQG